MEIKNEKQQKSILTKLYLKDIIKGIFILSITALIIFGLWNAIIPSIFDLPKINYWEALGLRILVKSFTGSIKRKNKLDYYDSIREKYKAKNLFNELFHLKNK